jgi:long-subunit fatty acid transport protein
MIWLLRFFTILFTIALMCGTLHAQALPSKVISASTPNPVGSGARAVGMGGAFIAVADDATAASWNPAGLTQLKKPEFSFALSYFSRRDDFASSSHPETSGLQKSLSKDLNYFSVASRSITSFSMTSTVISKRTSTPALCHPPFKPKGRWIFARAEN